MTHMIMEAEKMCSWQAGDQRKLMVRFQSKSQQVWESRRTNASSLKAGKDKSEGRSMPSGRRSSLLLHTGSDFLVLFRSSPDWRWPSTLGRKICFMQLTNSNTNVIPKHFHRHTKKNVWPNIWVSCGSVKRTQNYPSQYCSYGH